MFRKKGQPKVPGKPCRVFSFGGRPPTENAAVVDLQMLNSRKYKNAIIEAERNRRTLVDALLIKLSPELVQVERDVAAAVAMLDGIRETIDKASAAARKKVRPKELVAAAKEARTALAALRAKRKVLRKALFASDAFKNENKAIETAHKEKMLALRSACGAYWGSYLHVEQSMSKVRSGAPPEFKRWNGSGHLAVQLQGGAKVADLFTGKDTRVRISPVPEGAFRPDGRIACRKLCRVVVQMRVDSDEKGGPVFASIPIVLHRPMPNDAVVKWVHLIRTRIATKYRWDVQFVLSKDNWDRTDWAEAGHVGIDVGWRITGPDKRMRVAVWHGADGKSGELELPSGWLSEMGKVSHIQSSRDVNRDTMKASLMSIWGRLDKPEWLKEASEEIHHWESQARFSRLAVIWRDKRFVGDESAFDLLEAWRKRDKHLYEYEANLRDQLQARRLDIYRNFAAWLRRHYRTAFVEDLHLPDFHVLPKSEETPEKKAVREHTRDAALSYFLNAVKQSMRETVEVDPAGTTSGCSSCGAQNEFDRAQLFFTCTGCKTAWDQDKNAAINILKRGMTSKGLSLEGPDTQKAATGT